MIIQHNISALNSHRNLGINNTATSKNLEKLSSGYRVNRAGDDAAGLAISEKMRGQIRGLAMAEQNASNGISLIQTAEGGLNETHAILQRMRELAVQSANGTYHNEVDRENLNKEVDRLKDEIDRIASSTHYNGIKLLDGTMGGHMVNTGNDVTLQMDAATAASMAGWTKELANIAIDDTKIDIDKFAKKNGILTISTDDDGKITHVALQAGDKTYMASVTGAKGTESVVFFDPDSDTVPVAADAFADIGTALNAALAAADRETNSSYVLSFNFNEDGVGVTAGGQANANTDVDPHGVMYAGPKSELVFQIGANGSADQRVGLHVDNMSTGYIGNKNNKVRDISIGTRELANAAIEVIDDAINQVSGTRADLGALQNRLEHTLNNLGVTKENLTAAESSIRDVDMAKEMMEFTKNSILVQASQAMLAQANQLPQGVLSLLR